MSRNQYGGSGRSSWRGRGGWRPRRWARGNSRGDSNRPPAAASNSPPSSSDPSTSGAAIRTDNQPLISVMLDVILGPYPGWKLYHPQEAYMDGSPTAAKVKSMEDHIKRKGPVYNLRRCRDRLWYPVHLHVLRNDVMFSEEWPLFDEDLSEKPEYTLDCLGLAMHQVLSKQIGLTQAESGEVAELGTVRARVQGYEPHVPLRALKVNAYGKLVTVRGTVIRAGSSKLLCTWLTFSCSKCHTQQTIKQPAGIMTLPTSCSARECRARSHFNPLLDTPYTQTQAWQTLRLQEITSGEQFEGGRVPRSIDVELTADLVDVCCPGDDVTITGIVQVRACEDSQRKGQPSMFKLYLQGVSVQNQKEQPRDQELTDRDHEAIAAIRQEPQLFRLLVHSLCPAIYGHEVVKAGLLLGLFGGSECPGGGRKEPHVLVVGDPGLGKSQMLQSCASVAPRGVFVCGNSSTSAGLTVTVRQEGGGGLEAGALVLADQGVCCIDEFDKMSAHHQSLLEAMEQQSISVAKAGVVCTLPARTSILAAANPSGGHYDRSKTVAENLKIGPALLSRFDLVFILLDLPDQYLDGLLSEHVLALHSGSKNRSNINSRDTSISSGSQISNIELSLKERLKLLAGEELDHIPHSLLRKFIGYARKNVHPILTSQAADELQNFYLELRRVHQSIDATPVTTRQLEALVRLTQARARIELSDQATLQHAQDVLEVMKNSLVDVFSDGLGTVDFKRGLNGSGMSQSGQAKKFVNLLQKRATVQSRSVFPVSELREVASLGGLNCDFHAMLESLNVQGFLLKKGSQLYQLLSVDY